METKNMSLANIQSKLSRTEMKNIMAGSSVAICYGQPNGNCGSPGAPCLLDAGNGTTGRCYVQGGLWCCR